MCKSINEKEEIIADFELSPQEAKRNMWHYFMRSLCVTFPLLVITIFPVIFCFFWIFYPNVKIDILELIHPLALMAIYAICPSSILFYMQRKHGVFKHGIKYIITESQIQIIGHDNTRIILIQDIRKTSGYCINLNDGKQVIIFLYDDKKKLFFQNLQKILAVN